MAKGRGKRHLTKDEICARVSNIARERRMADRSPWTAMGIVTGYVLLKSEEFKGQRILKVAQTVEAMEEKWLKGELTVEECNKRLMDKGGWMITYKEYTEADIVHKKGSFNHWLDQIQLDPQNRINQQATRYMIFFFCALMDLYGYGAQRLTRVENKLLEVLESYKTDKISIGEWKQALYEECGVVYENPIDPLTQTSGSIMTMGGSRREQIKEEAAQGKR